LDLDCASLLHCDQRPEIGLALQDAAGFLAAASPIPLPLQVLQNLEPHAAGGNGQRGAASRECAGCYGDEDTQGNQQKQGDGNSPDGEGVATYPCPYGPRHLRSVVVRQVNKVELLGRVVIARNTVKHGKTLQGTRSQNGDFGSLSEAPYPHLAQL
jgi:hypothetical protein